MDNTLPMSLHSSPVCLFCSQPLRPLHTLDRAVVEYCDACEVGRIDPMPDIAALSSSYRSEARLAATERTGHAAGSKDEAEQFARTFRRKLRRLLRYGPIRDLLQIGCGGGEFLNEALRAGIPHVTGVDGNPRAADAARRSGLEVYHGSIEALPPAQQFDAIVMLDVLAHIHEPIPFLRSLRPYLRSGGHLFVMTPNIRSLVARLHGARWGSFDRPEHVFYYGPRGIRLLLERTGFDTVWVRGTGQYVTLGSLFRRLARLTPRLAAAAGGTVRLLRLDGRVVYAPNGSMDVVARAGRGA